MPSALRKYDSIHFRSTVLGGATISEVAGYGYGTQMSSFVLAGGEVLASLSNNLVGYKHTDASGRTATGAN